MGRSLIILYEIIPNLDKFYKNFAENEGTPFPFLLNNVIILLPRQWYYWILKLTFYF